METSTATRTGECAGRKRKASPMSVDTMYSPASKKQQTSSKVEKKTYSEITRAEIRRRVRKDSCDPNIYGELEAGGKLSLSFYEALGRLLALVTPIGVCMNKERKVLGHLLNAAMKQMNMEDSASRDTQQAETPAIVEFKNTDEESLLFEEKKNWPKFVKAMTEVAHEFLEAQLKQAQHVNDLIETIEEKKGKVKEIRRPLVTDPLTRDIFKEFESDLKESIRKVADDDEKAIKLLRDVIYKTLGHYADELRVLSAKCTVMDCLWEVILAPKNAPSSLSPPLTLSKRRKVNLKLNIPPTIVEKPTL